MNGERATQNLEEAITQNSHLTTHKDESFQHPGIWHFD
jgi:hypothetical protein